VAQIVLNHSTVRPPLAGVTLALAMFLLGRVTAIHRCGLVKHVKLEFALVTTSKLEHQIAISTEVATIPHQNNTLAFALLDGSMTTVQLFYARAKIVLDTENASPNQRLQSAVARSIIPELIVLLIIERKARQSFNQRWQLE